MAIVTWWSCSRYARTSAALGSASCAASMILLAATWAGVQYVPSLSRQVSAAPGASPAGSAPRIAFAKSRAVPASCRRWSFSGSPTKVVRSAVADLLSLSTVAWSYARPGANTLPFFTSAVRTFGVRSSWSMSCCTSFSSSVCWPATSVSVDGCNAALVRAARSAASNEKSFQSASRSFVGRSTVGGGGSSSSDEEPEDEDEESEELEEEATEDSASSSWSSSSTASSGTSSAAKSSSSAPRSMPEPGASMSSRTLR